MHLTVTYTLSEQGRKAAIREGIPATEQQTLTLDVPDSWLDEPWIEVDGDGHCTISYYRGWATSERNAACRALASLNAPLVDANQVWDRLNTALEAHRAEQRKLVEQERAQYDADIAEALRVGPEYFLASDWRGDAKLTTRNLNRSDPRIADLITQAERIRDEQIEAKKRSEQQAEEEREKAEERKTTQLREAVYTLGTQSQRERWDAGVMGRGEAIQLIVDHARSPLIDAGLAIYDSNEYHCEGDYVTEREIELLDDEQWQTARLLPPLIPDAEIGYYRQCGITEEHITVYHERVIARLTWTVGEIEIATDVLLSESRGEGE